MVTCRICNKEYKGLKKETAGYILLLTIIPFVILFGFDTGWLFNLGLGLYLIKVHHSKKYICNGCLKKKCPSCGKDLSSEQYCKDCKIIRCPFCKTPQAHDDSLSWNKTIVVLPGFLFLLIVAFVNPWLGMSIFLIYLYFQAPTCKNCNEKIHSSYFSMF